ncbi:MAG: ABC transporter permease, partial [Azospirillaceae bacterium]
RPGLLERAGLLRLMTEPSRMIARHILRRPLRSALTTLGIAMGGAVMVAAMFLSDSSWYLVDFHFNRMQRQDVTITFNQPAAPAILHAVAALPGVRRVEGLRVVAVEIAHGPAARPVGVTAVGEGDRLARLLDHAGRPIAPPPGGLVLGAALADVLDAAPGDRVRVAVKEGLRPVTEIPVTGVVEDYLGLGAYMAPATLDRLTGQGPRVSGARLAIDPAHRDALYTELARAPAVAGVSLQSAVRRSLDETMNQNIAIMTGMFTIFAGLIAVGVVYNSARVSLSERARELASLRVLGFTRGEVSYILLGELAVLTLAALPVGALVGSGFAWAMIQGFESEIMRLPFVVRPATYGAAALVVVVATALSALVVRRRIDRLDLIGVLKTRE